MPNQTPSLGEIRWPISAAVVAVWLLLPVLLQAQSSTEFAQVLERLARLEEANQRLSAEVRQLRGQLAAQRPDPAATPAGERMSVLESRVDEQAQTKVEASQRFPVRLTGMVLFNTFLNSRAAGAAAYPTIAPTSRGRSAGATFRQSVIGLDYRGPESFWGGKVQGSLLLDLFGGSGQSLDQLVRLRTASVTLGWKQRSFMAGIEKPIIAPREPNSLAQVGVSPLTGAGNLWLWIPQVRFEQDVPLGEKSGVRAQIGVVQTREPRVAIAAGADVYTPETEPSRPGLEGRLEFRAGSERRIEVAPGFHVSTSHIEGLSARSRLVSLDWLVRPLPQVDFTGAFFSGQNASLLGTGGAGGGLNSPKPGQVLPVHSRGGWGQLKWQATSRLSFNLFSGQQDNRNRDLLSGQVGKNLAYGANLFYRLAPNVILGLEASQLRTSRISSSTHLNNHYDLALAYLF